MKNIQSITYPLDRGIATKIQVQDMRDDLSTQCQFGWILFLDDGLTIIDNGSVTCDGTDYTGWDGNNDFPYTFVASKIGVTLI